MSQPEEKIEILPCPFCGCRETTFKKRIRIEIPWSVFCLDCNAESGSFDTAIEAAEQWNKGCKGVYK